MRQLVGMQGVGPDGAAPDADVDGDTQAPPRALTAQQVAVLTRREQSLVRAKPSAQPGMSPDAEVELNTVRGWLPWECVCVRVRGHVHALLPAGIAALPLLQVVLLVRD